MVLQNRSFFSFDLNIGPITLIFTLDLDKDKMYLYTEYEITSCSSLKITATRDRMTEKTEHIETHWQKDSTEIITYLHTQLAKMALCWVSYIADALQYTHLNQPLKIKKYFYPEETHDTFEKELTAKIVS